MRPWARALTSGMVILGLAIAAGLWRSPGEGPRPTVESRRVGAGAGVPAGPLGPTALEALDLRAELHLTEAQVRRLTALDQEWQQTAGPLEVEARDAEAEFRQYMDEAARSGRGTLAEIQRRAAEQGEVLAAFRARRAAHAGGVRQILTEEQRERWAALMAPQRTGERR